jgi:hypothetical protein
MVLLSENLGLISIKVIFLNEFLLFIIRTFEWNFEKHAFLIGVIDAEGMASSENI